MSLTHLLKLGGLIPFKLKLQNSRNTRQRSAEYFARCIFGHHVNHFVFVEVNILSHAKYFVSHRIRLNDTCMSTVQISVLEERLQLRV